MGGLFRVPVAFYGDTLVRVVENHRKKALMSVFLAKLSTPKGDGFKRVTPHLSYPSPCPQNLSQYSAFSRCSAHIG